MGIFDQFQNQQSAMNQIAQQANVYGTGFGLIGGGYGTDTGTSIQTVNPWIYYQQPLTEIKKAIEKTVQKTGKLLADLRAEIDGWHGDILKV